MTLGTTVYVVAYRMDAESQQEEKEFSSRQAAVDYQNTVQLLGGVAIVIPKFIPQGDMK